MTPILVLAILFVLAPVARAYAGRIRREDRILPGASPEEVARLREEVERLGGEVSRLHEEQAFMLRLLAPGGTAPSGAADPPTHNDSARETQC